MRPALIFKVNKLGDSIVFLPVVQELVRQNVFERIMLWTSPTAADLYANLAPIVQVEAWHREIFNSSWKHPALLLRLLRRSRQNHPQLALVAEDQGNAAHLLALLSGARERFGTPLPHIKIPMAVTEKVEWPLFTHSAEKSWAFGTALARATHAAGWPEKPPSPNLTHLIAPNSSARFDFLIHPGASLEYQRWPLPRYAELARRLAASHSVGWIDALPEIPDFATTRVTVLRPGNLSAFVTTLARSSIFIGNNSGPMHLASALGVPSVIISGPSSIVWNPYWHADRIRLLKDTSLPCIACDPPAGPVEHCLNAAQPFACMTSWTVDRVERIALDWHAAATNLPAAAP